MLANHPITGASIRIMKTETHVYKNQKTIVWLRTSPNHTEHANRLKRWDCVVTDYTLANEWKEANGDFPFAIILTQPTVGTIGWLQMTAPKSRQLLFLSRSVMEAYGQSQFQTDGFVNIICLEELAEMFPHVSYTYEAGEAEHLTVCSIAILSRASRVVGFTEDELQSEPFQTRIKSYANQFGLEVSGPATPDPLVLIQQYYRPQKARRAKEIDRCITKNIACDIIDSILLLNEQDEVPHQSALAHPKITQHIIGHRLTYADVMEAIQTKVPDNAIVVFANSDIYLDDSWRNLWSMNLSDTFLSLLRYEEPTNDGEEPQLFGPRPDSQDTWVVRADSVKRKIGSTQTSLQSFQFPFGKSGCDNAINVEMLRKKFVVANPCMTLRTIHCHSSQVRTYDPKDVVEKPIFLYLEPTGLHDLEPIKSIQPWSTLWQTPTPFQRKIHSAFPQALQTFCTMVSKGDTVQLQSNSDNMYEPGQVESLYTFPNSFSTPNGLVYGYKSIYMGDRREEWATASISHMTPCIGVESTFAVPLSEQDAQDPFQYIAYYLSRVFQLNQKGYKGHMWLPRDQRLHDCLQQFTWQDTVMPVIPYDKDLVSFSTQTVMMTPRAQKLLTREDCEALRSRIRGYEPTPREDGKRIVIIQDDGMFTSDDVLAMEQMFEEKGYYVEVVYPSRSSMTYMMRRMFGASFCIAPVGYSSLFWLLPRGAKLIEVMPELHIQGEGAHAAGAASVEYWVLLLQRAKKQDQRVILLDKLQTTFQAFQQPQPQSQQPTATPLQTTTHAPANDKPTIILPDRDTFALTPFEHQEDTFREMVRIWEQKGFVRIQRSKETPHCWLGGIGETLLYDRPTFSWLEQSPATYKQILCGNPDATKVPKGTQWSFWPRRPELVEQFVTTNPLPGYKERPKTLVFYGKIENQVQKVHRTNQYHEACDEYDCPTSTKRAYKYSQDEYLKQLAQSKFGLCLAGYGAKCNREIECLALGTVPVVAPDVDMDCYAVPPKENVHYIRLQSTDPEETKRQLQSITQEVWETMSAAGHQWWKEHASAEGLWNLTCKLSDMPTTHSS